VVSAACIETERNILEAGEGFAPGLNVGGDILVDTVKSRSSTVVPEVWGRGEVEVVCVPSEAGTQAEREFRLKVSDLTKDEITKGVAVEKEKAHH
jgi:hypothetical protein